jgi:hypothetical protein
LIIVRGKMHFSQSGEFPGTGLDDNSHIHCETKPHPNPAFGEGAETLKILSKILLEIM